MGYIDLSPDDWDRIEAMLESAFNSTQLSTLVQTRFPNLHRLVNWQQPFAAASHELVDFANRKGLLVALLRAGAAAITADPLANRPDLASLAEELAGRTNPERSDHHPQPEIDGKPDDDKLHKGMPEGEAKPVLEQPWWQGIQGIAAVIGLLIALAALIPQIAASCSAPILTTPSPTITRLLTETISPSPIAPTSPVPIPSPLVVTPSPAITTRPNVTPSPTITTRPSVTPSPTTTTKPTITPSVTSSPTPTPTPAPEVVVWLDLRRNLNEALSNAAADPRIWDSELRDYYCGTQAEENLKRFRDNLLRFPRPYKYVQDQPASRVTVEPEDNDGWRITQHEEWRLEYGLQNQCRSYIENYEYHIKPSNLAYPEYCIWKYYAIVDSTPPCPTSTPSP